MNENIIVSASFNPKVRNYWTVVATFICAVTFVGLVVAPIVALIAWVASQRILKAMSANLLERKLVVKRGIFFVIEKSIPLEKITDVALSQGPVMRYFGLYQLSFETAGQSGDGALVSLVGINDAAKFRETILAQKDKLSDNKANISAPDAGGESEMQILIKSVQNIENLLQKVVTKEQRSD